MLRKQMKKLQYDKFSKDILTSLFAQLIIIFLNLLITKLISMNFSVEDFGVFNIAKRSASLFAFIALMGLGISLPKYISIENATNFNDNAYKYWKAGLYILTSVLAIFSITFLIYKENIAVVMFDDENYSYMVFPIILNAVGTCLSSFLLAFYRGYNKIAVFNVLQVVYNIILFVLAIFLKKPLDLVMWWGIIWVLLSLIFILNIEINTTKSGPNKGSLVPYYKKLLLFGLPRLLGEFALFGYFLVPLIILNHKYNISISGKLSVSINFFQLATTFFGVIGYVLLPYVSEKIAQKKFKEINEKIKTLSIIYLLLSTIIVFVFYIFTKQIIILFYNTSYVSSVVDTRIVLIAIIPYTFYLLLRNPLDAVSDLPINTFNLLISFSILCGFVYYSNNIHSMGIGMIVSSSILCLFSWIAWRKYSKKW